MPAIDPIHSRPPAIAKDDRTVTITTQPVTPDPVTQDYDVNWLVGQRAKIVADAQAYADARQAEIDNIDDLLAQAAAVGVVPVSADPIVPDPVVPDPVEPVVPEGG